MWERGKEYIHSQCVIKVLPHCRHVFFAGCHDEGYVTFLSPYKHDQKIAPKITLIETHGTRPKFYELGFGMTKFPGIFRTEDFSRITTSFASQEPNRATTPVLSPSGATSWATSARTGLATSSGTIDIAPAKRASDGNTKKYYLVNAQDERVDEQLPNPPPRAQHQLDTRVQDENGGLNFCNQCNFFGPETCDKLTSFRHGKANLTPGEQLVLRQKVRGLPCSVGSWCFDPKCPYGHHCRFGYKCNKGEQCRFVSTHHVITVC